MPMLTVNTRQCSYLTAGDGFPLLLTSGAGTTPDEWDPLMPLLGELCHTIAYAYESVASRTPAMLADDFLTLMDYFALERAYLATTRSAIAMALHLALHVPTRLEGLVLIGEAEHRAFAERDRWHEISHPTLHIVGEQTDASGQHPEQVMTSLPHRQQIRIPNAGASPHREQPRHTGHAMMHFLTQCERQRTLVRGASFLL